MRMRIISKWRRDRGRPVSVEENAIALAYVIWQIALAAAKNLHAEDFAYETDDQRLAVITEYLAFLVHVSDRLAHSEMEDSVRERFINTLGREVARHLQRNQVEIIGPGDYRTGFITLLNERMAEYGSTAFPDNRPSFACLRCLGARILALMGNSHVNRWVIDQVMEIDAPAAVDHLVQAMASLFGTATVSLQSPPSD